MYATIIPVHNPERINSLEYNLNLLKGFVQKYQLEVLLIDDGSKSTDYLFKLERFEFLQIFQNKNNLGKAESINRLISHVQTEYITILDDDDLLTEKGVFERMNYASTKGGDLFIGAMKVMNNKEINEVRYVPRSSKTKLVAQLLSGFRTPFHSNAVLFKKKLFKSVGGMQPALMRVQDVDLSVKLLKAAKSFSISDSVHYVYHKHRSDYKSILQLRIKTMLYRFKMISNNTTGVKKYYHILKSFLIDSIKLVYSLVYRY